MAGFCSKCGMALPENANQCPGCGNVVGQPGGGGAAASPAQAGGLSDTQAGALCYVTIIPAIIFLVLEPYNRSVFIRFHAFQSIFYIAMCVLSAAVMFVGVLPLLGGATLVLWPLLYLAMLVVWVLTMIKAFSGQMWKLPVIGDIAEKQAHAM